MWSGNPDINNNVPHYKEKKMRNTKKYKEMLFDAGLELQNEAVYWLNGDAGLKGSERQKMRSLIGWLCKLPELLENHGMDKDLVVGSSFYENCGEQWFSLYGFIREPEGSRDIFEIAEVVNNIDDNGYIHHWEGFKKLLKMVNFKNLDSYLDKYFDPIEISEDKDSVKVSHTYSIHGIQNLVDYIKNTDSDKKWYIGGYLNYTNIGDDFIGSCSYSNKELFFWRSETNHITTLQVWYSYENNNKVVNHIWSSDYYIDTNEADEDSQWIYEWDVNTHEGKPIMKIK